MRLFKAIGGVIAKNRKKAIFLAGTALASGVVQIFPQAVSTDFDAYLKKENISPEYGAYFSRVPTRVYGRYNPLYPAHLAGIGINNTLVDPKLGTFLKIAGVPFFIAEDVWSTLAGTVRLYAPPYSGLDAFSTKADNADGSYACFIRPPGEVSVSQFVSEMTQVDDIEYKPVSDPQKLSRIFNEVFLMHERRHCDQGKTGTVAMNENDSDLYAFNVVARVHKGDVAEIREAAEITAQLRIFHAVVGGDTEHMTESTLLRGYQTFMQSLNDRIGYAGLRILLDGIVGQGKDVFNGNYKLHEQYYYAAKAVLRDRTLQPDPKILNAARDFVGSVEYINKMAGGKFITAPDCSAVLYLGGLMQDYSPAPAKFPVHSPLP